ncbi:hypothetical protein V1477_000246 [Vespula maculifrons]|uniref:Uncharacterized protein n=1 Tax=Vespula maculifrons TaxID=7453 RepID=A0ABD2D119_VESMC
MGRLNIVTFLQIFYIPFKFSPANAPLQKYLTTGTLGKYSNIINSKLSISELQYSEINIKMIECFFNFTISLIFLNTVQICILVPLIKIATHSAMFLHTRELCTELQTDRSFTIPPHIETLLRGNLKASITVFNCSALFKELSNKVFNSSQYIPIVQGCILKVNVDICIFGILGKYIATRFSFPSKEFSMSSDTV